MIQDFEKIFEIWTEKIPVVKAMQLSFEFTDRDNWQVMAPLEPNRNHMGTGFGGSIAAIATLAGWAQIWMLIDDPATCDIVIAKSKIRYLHPATGELQATAKRPGKKAIERFQKTLKKKSKAALEIKSVVRSNGKLAARLKGRFVAIRKK